MLLTSDQADALEKSGTVPDTCEFCSKHLDSWDDYFQCIADHSCLSAEEPQSDRDNAYKFTWDKYHGGDNDEYSDISAIDPELLLKLPQAQPIEEDLQCENFAARPVPSDSGYHSSLRTDSESVCSMGSVGSSLGLPKDLLQDFIAFFANTLFDRVGAQLWAEYALALHPPESIEQHLNRALRDYAIEISAVLEQQTEALVRLRFVSL